MTHDFWKSYMWKKKLESRSRDQITYWESISKRWYHSKP